MGTSSSKSDTSTGTIFKHPNEKEIQNIQNDSTYERSRMKPRVSVPVPPKKCGYLYKQGHIIKNWKRRFFILDRGILYYYSHVGHDNIGVNEKGI